MKQQYEKQIFIAWQVCKKRTQWRMKDFEFGGEAHRPLAVELFTFLYVGKIAKKIGKFNELKLYLLAIHFVPVIKYYTHLLFQGLRDKSTLRN